MENNNNICKLVFQIISILEYEIPPECRLCHYLVLNESTLPEVDK